MSNVDFVCHHCGRRHPGLPFDYGFRRPDDVHALTYLEEYRRVRLNADLCTLDDRRYFVRGVLSIPVVRTTHVFGWGVWVEVTQRDHDFYVAHFHEDLSSHPRFPATLANDIPGYGGTVGLELEVQYPTERSRPALYLPSRASHPLADEQRQGITAQRHHDMLEAVGFFDR